ncbi:MAG: hypothetical protein HYU28_12540 [Actinobacteria bacterium]|nr:hypothetical protein [Actinomycetota bacterium]
MISDEALDRLALACGALPKAEGVYLDDDFVMALMATVLDFQMHTTAVVRALNHFKANGWDTVRTCADLEVVMASYPDTNEGNTALAQQLWGNRHWKRAGMLRALTAYFRECAVTDLDGLRTWARSSTFEGDFAGKVKGLGPAVYQWLVMRQGVETIKPDVHVRRFAEGVLDRPLSDREIVDSLEAIAVRLGMPAYELDWAIWEAGRAGSFPPTLPAPGGDAETPA